MLSKIKRKWSQFRWQLIPIEKRIAIVEEQEREYQSPENRAARWDAFCDEHDTDTVGEVIRVRWSSESHCQRWLAARGLSGNERAADVFGPTERRPVPEWFDRLGGSF